MKRPRQEEWHVQSSEDLGEGLGRSKMGWRSQRKLVPAGMEIQGEDVKQA